MNILETPITLFDGVTSTNGHVVSLAEFLNDASSHHLILQIRMADDKVEPHDSNQVCRALPFQPSAPTVARLKMPSSTQG